METSEVSPALQERLGVEATVGLLELFDTARQEWTVEMTTIAVDRFERRLSEEIGAFRLEMKDALAALRLEMREANVSLRQEMRDGDATLRQEMRDGDATLRQEMGDGFARLRQDNDAARFELLKWSFVFWIGQVFAMAGVVAIVFRLMGE